MKKSATAIPQIGPWTASAAYLYTLDLDGPGLAWEYLRRHPRYCADWQRRQRITSFNPWGLRWRRRSHP